ncbi:Predicted kinase, aminoglycoside phosphotransferase (APT) family [Oceanobacillus limi]|uniref:Predicted kinase, aminoglycoside phosphotransferase (APT) family n=1 Tax=Oceanobacillus limi TaxID=930131 RepID=A0A1I0FF11_9BACI|nr:aminoglycoside phosphotransferase family protein [Oceanobacillus limi]SET56496.1 Predicted kinase, aminoglycoside phosphotransferase (APT) family [Oceanobacillus limi]
MTDTLPQQVIDKHSFINNNSSVKELHKGFSSDNKYIIDDTYLLRTFSSQTATERMEEFEYITIAATHSDYVPRAIAFDTIEELGLSYMILTFLPGEDGEVALKYLSDREQYKAGYRAGEELRKIHHIPAPKEYSGWYETKKKKSDKYISQLEKINLEEDMKLLLKDYIKQHEHLMVDRPNTIQHDDFHPSNLLIKDNQFAGIIDFQRMDWGDPVHDLHKLGFFSKPVSIPFTNGIIDGYHGGRDRVTMEFWRLYALYSAMHVVSAYVWGQNQLPEQNDLLREYSIAVLDDHDNFKQVIPKWYPN